MPQCSRHLQALEHTCPRCGDFFCKLCCRLRSSLLCANCYRRLGQLGEGSTRAARRVKRFHQAIIAGAILGLTLGVLIGLFGIASPALGFGELLPWPSSHGFLVLAYTTLSAGAAGSLIGFVIAMAVFCLEVIAPRWMRWLDRR